MLTHKKLLLASAAAIFAIGTAPALAAGNYESNSHEEKGARYQVNYESREEAENQVPVDIRNQPDDRMVVTETVHYKTKSKKIDGPVLLKKEPFTIPERSSAESEHSVPNYTVLSSYDSSKYDITTNEKPYDVNYKNPRLPLNATYGMRDKFQEEAMNQLNYLEERASRIDVSDLDSEEKGSFASLQETIDNARFEFKMMDEVNQDQWHQTKLETIGLIDRINKQSAYLMQQS